MDTVQRALTLVDKFAANPHATHENFRLPLEQYDNELAVQLLLVIYNECFKKYVGSIDIRRFTVALDKCFQCFGFQLRLERLTEREMESLSYYVKIRPDMSMVRSPYHAFSLREYMIKDGYPVPASFNKLFYDPTYLSYVVNIHMHDGLLHTVQFKKLSAHTV
jgi:hypothetical protein